MLSTALMMCTTASFPTTAAFTAIPALNLPALQAKRIINPTLRELNFLCAKDGGPEAAAEVWKARRSGPTRRERPREAAQPSQISSHAVVFFEITSPTRRCSIPILC